MNLQDITIKLLESYYDEYHGENLDDFIYKVTVYKVCMDTYSGKRLYLAQNDVSLMSWKDAKTYDWQFDPRGAMEFDTFEEAEEFAKKYFKHFDRWYIYETVGYR